MAANYRVKVYKDYFDFSAAHFITLGGKCETLHGHNYRVEATLSGKLGQDQFLYNFSSLKPIVRSECRKLDHCMLLAANNPLLSYRLDGQNIEVQFGKRRYLFPSEEVVMLPIENTTAEQLAAYLLKQIRHELILQNQPETLLLHSIEIGVEEQPGQIAYYSEDW